jgi:hypothetical protein
VNDVKAFGYVDETGKLKLFSQSEFIEQLKAIPNTIVTLTLSKSGKRSSMQNRYYFGGVIPIVRQGLKDMGIVMSAEQTHSLLKFRFLKQEFISNDGEVIESTGSTKELSKQEFNEYIERIKQWAAEYLNIQIPDPEEQTTIEI